MQIQLLQPEPLVPLPLDAGHYVPALQNKRGELDALRHASEMTWERMTPLVHFVGRKQQTKPLNAVTIRSWVAKVASAVGSHPFYLDVMRLNPTFDVATTKGNVPALQAIYAAARKRRLRFVPVISVGESLPAHQRLVADAALEDGNGVALRYRIRKFVPPAGSTLRNYLREQLTAVTAAASNADLLVDLDYIDPDTELNADDVAASLEEMLQVGPWRAVVLLGTSMPSTLSCIDEGSVGSLRRHEWDLWLRLEQCDLPRMPSFGDYAIQHPRPPQDSGPGMRANIRYTANRHTLVARGQGSVVQEGNTQYRLLCQQIVTRTEFEGSDYSWGDRVIADCARGMLAPRGQPLWRGAGTSHHLQFVTDQLRQRQRGS